MNSYDIVGKYTNAWINQEFDKARLYLADDLRFRGSIDSFDNVDQLIEALKNFVPMLTKVEMIDQLYDENRAFLLYDCITENPAGTIRTAEHFTIENGKIKEIKLVFDTTILRKLMGEE